MYEKEEGIKKNSLGHESLGTADVLADIAKGLIIMILFLIGLDNVGVVRDRNASEAEPQKCCVQTLHRVTRHLSHCHYNISAARILCDYIIRYHKNLLLSFLVFLSSYR